MATFDLVIFDSDGVLVDSEAIGNAVLADVLTGYGVVLTLEDARQRYAGLSVGAIRLDVQKHHGIDLPEDWTEIYYPKLIAALAERVRPVDGIIDVVARLQRAGIVLCVASQGPLAKTEASLKRVGLLDAFGGRIFSAKSVLRPKPAPDLFLHAAEACGAAPERCAVIEDSQTGVSAARAAGMTVFAYCPQNERGKMRKLGALPFHSMVELPRLLNFA